MMLFADIGNTRLKWCVVLAPLSPALATGTVVHDGRALSVLQQLFAEHAITQAYVCDVSGQTAAQAFDGRLMRLMSTAAACGVINAYQMPEKLGADRWFALIAAWHRVRDTVIVVDAGTALTIDVVTVDSVTVDSVTGDTVTARGQHQGGFILPGLQLQLQALQRTREARPASWVGGYADLAPGVNTAEAIEKGVLHSLVGAILSVRQGLCAKGLRPVLLTGGDADVLRPFMSAPVLLEPDLVLTGMQYAVAASAG